jgi:RNA:NAD 2'-phosphotransferase (TPT1/KptA family)
MDPDRITRVSRFLSFVLRHRPEAIDLTIDDAGWLTEQVPPEYLVFPERALK